MFYRVLRNRLLSAHRLLPVVLVLFAVACLVGIGVRAPQEAWASAADTINFQARLQTNTGAIVPDGDYNIQFNLYDTATGGSPLWTETYEDYTGTGGSDDRLVVKDGYFSAQLGSITPFPDTIDWSQQLYLTMNVGGTSDAPVWDGEMAPRLALTATPYAFEAQQADQASELSVTSSGNTSTLTLQAPASGDESFVIQDQGSAGTYDLLTTQAADNSFIQLQSGTPVQQSGSIDVSGAVTAGSIAASSIDAATAGAITIGGTNATGIVLGNGTSNILTTIQAEGISQTLTGSSTTPSDVIETSTNSTAAFSIQNSSGYNVLSTDTSNDLVSLGSSNRINGSLVFYNSSDTSTVEIETGVTDASYTLTMPLMGASGAECLESASWSTATSTALQFASCASSSGAYINDGTSTQAANMDVQAASGGSVAGTLEAASTGSGDILDLLNGSGVTVESFSSSGAALIKPSSDSLTAFQVQESGSGNTTPVLDVDTTDARVGINTGAPGYALDVNGAINSNSNIYINGVAVCTTSGCGGSGGGSGSYIDDGTSLQTANLNVGSASASAVTGTFQGASSQTANILDLDTYNGTSSTVVDSFGSTGNVDINPSETSTTAFLIQNGSVSLFTADTTDSLIVIGSNSATNTADTTLLQLNSYDSFSESSLTCSTTSNQGALYYSSDDTSGTNTIRACANGEWQDVLTSGDLGLELFGVVPDSPNAGTPGDIAGISGNNNSPCKVYYTTGDSGADVSVAPCVAYSGGREVIVSATTLSLSSIGASSYVNVCLTGTNSQPALVGTGSTSEGSVPQPTWSATAPILCLATVETGATAGVVADIYDVRTFTDTTKAYATYYTSSTATLDIGMEVIQNSSISYDGITPATAGGGSAMARGVVVAYSGSSSSSTVNVIIATGGPQWVKAVSGGAAGGYVYGTTTVGYVTDSSSSASSAIYGNLGISTVNISGSSCSSVSTCQDSQFLDPLDIR